LGCFMGGSFHDELRVSSGCLSEKRKSPYSRSEAALQVSCITFSSFPSACLSIASSIYAKAEVIVFEIFCICIFAPRNMRLLPITTAHSLILSLQRKCSLESFKCRGSLAFSSSVKSVERQVFGCSDFCSKYSCYDRVFLLAFSGSRRRSILGEDPQRMGDNCSSIDYSLRCSFCGGMDRLGFGFHSAAPPCYWGTFRGLRKDADYFFFICLRKTAKTATITNTIKTIENSGSIPNA